MSGGLAYLLAHLLAVVPGLPVLCLDPVRRWRWPAKAAAAFAAGSVLLSAQATIAALLGVRWSVPLLLALPVLAMFPLARRLQEPAAPPADPAGKSAAQFALAAAAVAFAHLAWRLVAAQATSVDFLLFWGAKAVRFAQAGAIDTGLLAHPFFGHARPAYPPLVPVVDALAVQAAGGMPWNVAPLVTLLWLAAAALLVREPLRRLDPARAPIPAAFWTAALAASLGVSFSGASAEAPLVLFVSAAGALLLTERPEDALSERWMAGLFLAGAVSTKVEGTVAALLLLLGIAVRDRLSATRRPLRGLLPLIVPPLVAGSLWLGVVAKFRLPTDSPGRGALFEVDPARASAAIGAMARSLEAGTLWLSWGLALLLLAWTATRAGLRQVLPGLVTVTGSFLLFLAVYLHEPKNISERVGWEMPRLSQPSLSLLILAAAVTSLGRVDNNSFSSR